MKKSVPVESGRLFVERERRSLGLESPTPARFGSALANC